MVVTDCVRLGEVGGGRLAEASLLGLQTPAGVNFPEFFDGSVALSPLPSVQTFFSDLLHDFGRYLHRDAALEQVDVHHERRPTPLPALDQSLDPFERPGNDPDAI